MKTNTIKDKANQNSHAPPQTNNKKFKGINRNKYSFSKKIKFYLTGLSELLTEYLEITKSTNYARALLTTLT